jgi:hypothetical protein
MRKKDGHWGEVKYFRLIRVNGYSRWREIPMEVVFDEYAIFQ